MTLKKALLLLLRPGIPNVNGYISHDALMPQKAYIWKKNESGEYDLIVKCPNHVAYLLDSENWIFEDGYTNEYKITLNVSITGLDKGEEFLKKVTDYINRSLADVNIISTKIEEVKRENTLDYVD